MVFCKSFTAVLFLALVYILLPGLQHGPPCPVFIPFPPCRFLFSFQDYFEIEHAYVLLCWFGFFSLSVCVCELPSWET